MFNSAVLLLFGSNTIYIVMTCFVLTLILIANELNIKLLKKKFPSKNDVSKYAVIDENNNGDVLKEAPGPKPKFVVGNLDALGGYEIPYQAFNDLAEKYGNVVKLQLGSVPSMVINGMENIREVLVHKGHHFDSRPNFRRYHMLFSGNKENCKWLSAAFRSKENLLKRALIPPLFRPLSIGLLRLVGCAEDPPRNAHTAHVSPQVLDELQPLQRHHDGLSRATVDGRAAQHGATPIGVN